MPAKTTPQDNTVTAEPITEVVTVPEESALTSPTLSLDDLKQSVEIEAQKRQVIKEFVQSQLIDGTDYMKLPFGQNAKPSMLKPGAEKICSLFQLSASYTKDTDTWEMLGSKEGVVAYLCQLRRGEQIVSEGRGVATVGDKGRDANATVKIAEKRAKMDACLSLGFSDYFTQDLEDMDSKESAVERQSSRFSDQKESVPDGTHTICVEDIYTGTTKTGEPYQAISTELGRLMVWKSSGLLDTFKKDVTYDVTVKRGAVSALMAGQEEIPF